MKAELENHPDRGELSRFIDSAGQATFFHTPAWVEVLGAAFHRFDAAWLTVRRGGELSGVMPVVRVSRGPFHSLFSLPFGTYGDPLARDDETRRALLGRFFEMARAPLCAEASAVLFSGEIGIGAPGGIQTVMEECRLVPLDGGFDDVWSRVSSKRRQLCRRGEEAGVVVRTLEGEGEVRDFHDIYRMESRGWGGVHPYPLELFVELFKRRESGVLIWGAFLEGSLLGAHIDFYYGAMAQAWQGGAAQGAKGYEVGALLLKRAIEEACRRRMRSFNLGSSGGNEGILFFKESLGGREHRYAVCTATKSWWRFARGR